MKKIAAVLGAMILLMASLIYVDSLDDNQFSADFMQNRDYEGSWTLQDSEPSIGANSGSWPTGIRFTLISAQDLEHHRISVAWDAEIIAATIRKRNDGIGGWLELTMPVDSVEGGDHVSSFAIDLAPHYKWTQDDMLHLTGPTRSDRGTPYAVYARADE